MPRICPTRKATLARNYSWERINRFVNDRTSNVSLRSILQASLSRDQTPVYNVTFTQR